VIQKADELALFRADLLIEPADQKGVNFRGRDEVGCSESHRHEHEHHDDDAVPQ
jgi:hypothetical protein